ncbi:MAG: hypothetical protein JNM56_05750, partial [Planctomycetia bacterium]|nr:hypothetical protein [Planctomycetia bacterium]
WGGGWGWAGAPRWGWGGWGVNYWRPWVPTYSWGCYQPWVSYSVSPVYYYYPISTTVDVVSAPNYTQAIARVEPTRVYGQPNGGVVQSAPPTAPPQNGTYYYDGGPQNPVPLPKSNTAPPRPAPQLPPALPQQKTQPLEGIPVSLPATTQAKFAYPAYGEKPVQTNFAVDRVPTTTVKK